jgi:peroxiredoxin
VELQARMAEIKDLGGQVVAVSVDPLAQSQSLAGQLKLAFPIVEDLDHAWGSAFGVFHLPGGMDMGPVDSHSIFVVDASGHIRWKELAPDTMHVPVDDVIGALKQA